MDLSQMIRNMNVPPFEEAMHGDACGTVTLRYGGEETEFHTQYIQLFGVVRDNPGRTFEELALIAEGVESDMYSVTLDRPGPVIGVMHRFQTMGALDIKDSKQRDVFWEPPVDFMWYRANAHYTLSERGLARIDVVRARPKDLSKEREFFEYFR